MAISDINKLSKTHTLRIYPRNISKNKEWVLVQERDSNGKLTGSAKSVQVSKSQTTNDYSRGIVVPLPKNIQMKVGSTYEDFFTSGSGSLSGLLNTLGLSVGFKWANVQVWKSNDPLSITIPIELVAFQNAGTEIYKQSLRILSMLSPNVLSPNNYAGGVLAATGILTPPGPDLLEELSSQFADLLQNIRNAVVKDNQEDKIGLISAESDIGRTIDKVKDNGNLFEHAKKVRDNLLGLNTKTSTINIEVGQFLIFRKMVLTGANIVWGDDKSSMMPMNPQGFPLKATLNLSFVGTEIWTETYTDSRDRYSSTDGLIERALEKAFPVPGDNPYSSKDRSGNYVSKTDKIGSTVRANFQEPFRKVTKVIK